MKFQFHEVNVKRAAIMLDLNSDDIVRVDRLAKIEHCSRTQAARVLFRAALEEWESQNPPENSVPSPAPTSPAQDSSPTNTEEK